MMNNVVVVGESKNTKVKSGVFSANAIDVSSKLSSIQTIANEEKTTMSKIIYSLILSKLEENKDGEKQLI